MIDFNDCDAFSATSLSVMKRRTSFHQSRYWLNASGCERIVLAATVAQRPNIFETVRVRLEKSQRDFTLVVFIFSRGFSVTLIRFGF